MFWPFQPDFQSGFQIVIMFVIKFHKQHLSIWTPILSRLNRKCTTLEFCFNFQRQKLLTSTYVGLVCTLVNRTQTLHHHKSHSYLCTPMFTLNHSLSANEQGTYLTGTVWGYKPVKPKFGSFGMVICLQCLELVLKILIAKPSCYRLCKNDTLVPDLIMNAMALQSGFQGRQICSYCLPNQILSYINW